MCGGDWFHDVATLPGVGSLPCEASRAMEVTGEAVGRWASGEGPWGHQTLQCQLEMPWGGSCHTPAAQPLTALLPTPSSICVTDRHRPRVPVPWGANQKAQAGGPWRGPQTLALRVGS